ncbi:MAG: hypothetical protein SOV29_01370, partial [Oscillospiraceae bacterium]|nr:hypothetical protein [Oscillospiraceae bacterium]
RGKAKKSVCKFEPAAIFKCSAVKENIDVNLYASCDVAFLGAFKTCIASDINVKIDGYQPLAVSF